MRLGSKPPLIFLTAALLALLVLLASLQYVWLGRISHAERERLQATLSQRAAEFGQDFDRELTRAFLLFQTEPMPAAGYPSARLAERYDRWLATSTYPRLLKEFYVAHRTTADEFRLQRFDVATRALLEVPWPPAMADWRAHLFDEPERMASERGVFVRRLPPPIWETVPALVVPAPVLLITDGTPPRSFSPPVFGYTLLTLDVDYIRNDLLADLDRRHFRKTGDTSEYQVAVIESDNPAQVIYQSSQSFRAGTGRAADASAPFFQVRTGDFSSVAAEVRRFTTFTGTTIEHVERRGERTGSRQTGNQPGQVKIVVQQGSLSSKDASAGGSRRAVPPARWRVIVQHPAGSLEAFVGSTRRRNLIVSTSILAVLGASMALLIVSTRRSQKLARQQLEFVAAVSHELRTPLAVIRSAGENLADGVIQDGEQLRKYGELIRGEGRRLSDMVEQILEFAGIQSGQRGFVLRPVDVGTLVGDVVAASRTLIDEAGLRVEVDVPDDLPPARADEPALRRVVQNLISNAIKYGAGGGWIGIKARADASRVSLSVSDRGIGIASAEQAHIFEPFYRAADVIAARIQGAGLGLSLVRRIVEGHGGEISVKSTPGHGSEFTVSIPVASGDAPERLAASHASAEPAQSS